MYSIKEDKRWFQLFFWYAMERVKGLCDLLICILKELDIQAFKKGQFQSLQAAALTYDAPITTVRRRACGIRSRRDSQPSNRKLSSTEEETLIQWILSMDQRKN
jgi:hypothetical protein